MTLTLLGLMAFQYISIPYKWGGKDVLGLDCSGLVEKTLHDVGITIPRLNSQDIYKWAIKKDGFLNYEPCADCLLFFGSSTGKIRHVAIAIDQEYMIEAGGAGSNSSSMSQEELAHRDARVRVKKISSRKDLVASIKINYGAIQ